jgi:SAM-dependent methyltransferase
VETDKNLTPRQQREREFYDEYSLSTSFDQHSFDPIRGNERRPWNPVWFVFEQAVGLYSDAARKLLELGCGTGDNAITLAQIGYDVVGVDISQNSILAAQRNASLIPVKGSTTFECGVAERLNHPDASFDVVVGMNILHHVDVGPAVAEALRVLKPGGTAIFREWMKVQPLDALRNLPPLVWMFPVGKSLDRHVTEDELKLTRKDLAHIRRLCPATELHHFRILARMHSFLGYRRGRSSPLERFDRWMIRAFPAAGRLGGAVVIILRK